jgi:hypothetical protein
MENLKNKISVTENQIKKERLEKEELIHQLKRTSHELDQ